jgi:OmpA-OmpF porin, OOP family
MKFPHVVSLATATVCAATVMLLSHADAQEVGVYVAGDIGQSKYAISAKDAGLLGGGVAIDQKDTQSGFAVGGQLNKTFAVELGYTDFGKAKISGTGAIPCSPAIVCLPALFPVSGDGRAKSTHLSLLSSVPVTEAVSIFGRVGASRTDLSTLAQVGSARATTGEKKTEVIYGFGAAYAFNKNVDATLEWKKLNDTDVDAFSVGLRYRF